MEVLCHEIQCPDFVLCQVHLPRGHKLNHLQMCYQKKYVVCSLMLYEIILLYHWHMNAVAQCSKPCIMHGFCFEKFTSIKNNKQSHATSNFVVGEWEQRKESIYKNFVDCLFMVQISIINKQIKMFCLSSSTRSGVSTNCHMEGSQESLQTKLSTTFQLQPQHILKSYIHYCTNGNVFTFSLPDHQCFV